MALALRGADGSHRTGLKEDIQIAAVDVFLAVGFQWSIHLEQS